MLLFRLLNMFLISLIFNIIQVWLFIIFFVWIFFIFYLMVRFSRQVSTLLPIRSN